MVSGAFPLNALRVLSASDLTETHEVFISFLPDVLLFNNLQSNVLYSSTNIANQNYLYVMQLTLTQATPLMLIRSGNDISYFAFKITNMINMGTLQFLLLTSIEQLCATCQYNSKILDKNTYQLTMVTGLTGSNKFQERTLSGPLIVGNKGYFVGLLLSPTRILQSGLTTAGVYSFLTAVPPPPPAPVPPIVQTPDLAIQEAFFSIERRQIILQFSEALVNAEIYIPLLDFEVKNHLGAPFTVFSITKIGKDEFDHRRLLITIEVRESLFDATVTVRQKDPTTKLFYSTYRYYVGTPVTVKSVTLMIGLFNSFLDAVSYTASIVLGVVGICALVFTVPFFYSIGINLLQIMNYFTVLRFLNGEKLYYPEFILYTFSGANYFPVLRNSFRIQEAKLECQLKGQFQQGGLSCNFFNNYSVVAIIYACLFLVTVTVNIFHYLMKMKADIPDEATKKKIQESCSYRLSRTLFKNFGFGYFLIILVGDMMAVMLYALLNASTTNLTIGQILGVVLSGFFFLFYLVYSLFSFSFILSFLKIRSTKWEEIRSAESKLMKQLKVRTLEEKDQVRQEYSEEAFYYDKDTYIQGSFIISLWRKDKTSSFYFAHLLSLLRNTGVVFVLYFAVDKGFAQVVAIGSIELVYCLTLLVTRLNHKWYYNLLEVANSFLFVAFIALKGVLFMDFSSSDKQYLFGGIMSGILLLIVVLNAVYVAFFVVYSVILTLIRLFGLNDPKINRDDREDLGRINESNVHFPEIEDSQIFKPPEKPKEISANESGIEAWGKVPQRLQYDGVVESKEVLKVKPKDIEEFRIRTPKAVKVQSRDELPVEVFKPVAVEGMVIEDLDRPRNREEDELTVKKEPRRQENRATEGKPPTVKQFIEQKIAERKNLKEEERLGDGTLNMGYQSRGYSRWQASSDLKSMGIKFIDK